MGTGDRHASCVRVLSGDYQIIARALSCSGRCTCYCSRVESIGGLAMGLGCVGFVKRF
jgi:hypothetical protein